jgi:CheY-like chemotaxis protein
MTNDPFLVVEDEPGDAILIQRAFAKANVPCPVHIVRDGDQAVEYLDGAGAYSDRARYPLPKVMLLDLKLPRRSGLEVLEWVRKKPGLRRLSVVILTSSRESTDVNRAWELGVSSYLVKPVDYGRLVDMVSALNRLMGEYSEHPTLTP